MDALHRFDFMGLRRTFGVLSIVLVLASLGLLVGKGLNLGLDFTGGALIEVSSPQDIVIQDARNALQGTPYDDAVIQHFGSARDVVVRVAPKGDIGNDEVGLELFALLEGALPEVELRRVEFVGPQVGNELRDQSGLALLMALGAMLIYIWFRFTNKFGVAAVVALFHDVVIVLGVFSLFQWQVDLTVLAALLALIGYSINDSIVVADYVRDMFRTTRLNNPAEIVNSAIQLTIGRTVNTSLTTLLVVLALQFFGGEAVHSFSLALSIGIIVGTYSSIYIVCNLALAMKLDKEDFIIPIVEEVDEAP
ncbi:protein translocase subunit SecF [Alcanivorax sp. 1008]|uniref:protein translocase subunit SecF n=1 Tax=Alcanivorax sp. 1008 TaxID=2816853 RepID=UPI001D7F4FD7|nr:protein translocase subunit SecF [Alcanivorax sp. 1008]MCC1497333.1 protein translocase subunit SecF [Alcanivorax sp. 1008]